MNQIKESQLDIDKLKEILIKIGNIKEIYIKPLHEDMKHNLIGYNPITNTFPSLPWGFLARKIVKKMENNQVWIDDYNIFYEAFNKAD